jgi:hypothetical protein
MATRRSQTLSVEEKRVLLDRIADLELRMKLLEARVRRESAEAKSRGRLDALRPAGKVVRTPKERPRCPGCTLEIPRGPRGVERLVRLPVRRLGVVQEPRDFQQAPREVTFGALSEFARFRASSLTVSADSKACFLAVPE